MEWSTAKPGEVEAFAQWCVDTDDLGAFERALRSVPDQAWTPAFAMLDRVLEWARLSEAKYGIFYEHDAERDGLDVA